MNDRPIARLRASFNVQPEYLSPSFDRPAMLQFQFANGRILALAYSHSYRVELLNAETIELQFSSHVVTLVGASVASLFGDLVQMQVGRVEEVDPLRPMADGPRVTAITVRETVGINHP